MATAWRNATRESAPFWPSVAVGQRGSPVDHRLPVEGDQLVHQFDGQAVVLVPFVKVFEERLPGEIFARGLERIFVEMQRFEGRAQIVGHGGHAVFMHLMRPGRRQALLPGEDMAVVGPGFDHRVDAVAIFEAAEGQQGQLAVPGVGAFGGGLLARPASSWSIQPCRSW